MSRKSGSGRWQLFKICNIFYSLEMVLEVPAKSYLEISIEFEKSLLKWLEYPPDANKGFYIGSALISTLIPTKEDSSNLGKLDK